MAPRSFTDADRSKIWNRMPEMNTKKIFRTRYPSKSPYKLTVGQLREWSNFPDEVKKEIRIRTPLGEPAKGYKVVSETMHHNTGNEMVVQAAFVTFVSHQINEGFAKSGLGMRMGDYETGISSIKGAKIDGRKPDLVMWECQKRHTRVVGEIKTNWTTESLEGEHNRKHLAAKIGQLARYMDDLHCTYGFFTTYNITWFVKRIDNRNFAVTKPIKATMYSFHSSTSKVPRISVKECFFFIAKRALEADSVYSQRVGKSLTRREIVGRGAKKILRKRSWEDDTE